MSLHPDGRYVDDAPYDADDNLSAIERADMDAPSWVLIWRKFKRHRLGLISGIFLLLCYLILPIAGFISPYGANERSADHLYAPPQSINLWHDGKFIGPYVYPISGEADLVKFQWIYTEDTTTPRKLNWFCEGAEYRLFGLIKSDTHPARVPAECAPGLLAWLPDRPCY